MTCGLTVIVTGKIPTTDYAGAGTAYLVAALRLELPDRRVGDLETLDRPAVLEHDREAVVEQLRPVAADRDGVRAKRAAASV